MTAATTNRRVTIAFSGAIVLFAILSLGTCVGPEPGRLPDRGPGGGPGLSPAGGRGGGLRAPSEVDAAGPARESAEKLGAGAPSSSTEGIAQGGKGSLGEDPVDPVPPGYLVVLNAATGEIVPYFALRFRDRERRAAIAATDDRGRLEAFRRWLGRGVISILDDPTLPRERWRAAPDPVWNADHYELSVDVGPTWRLSLTGYGPGEEDVLEAWLQVPEGLAFPRDGSRTIPVRWEGGGAWVRLPAFGPGMGSFVARQTKCLVVRSPREERTGWASVEGVIGRQERPLEIDLKASYVLRGRVHNPEGRALADASVLLWPEGERLGSRASVGSTGVGPDGRFEVFGLRERRYSAKFMAAGHEDLRRVVDVTEPGGTDVVLAPRMAGEHALLVHLVGSRGTSTLAASLFPVDGLGESRDAELELEAGRFVGTFAELDTGRYRLHVELGSGEAVVGHGEGGDVEVTVPLDGPVVLHASAVETVELRVTLDGRDLDRSVVFYGSGDGREFGPIASISRFGRVRLPLTTLEHPLWALMDGYQPAELGELEPAVGPVSLDLTPREGWGVFLRVVDGQGPVAGILATLRGDGLGRSDARGTIAVGLEPQQSALTVELLQGEAVVGSKELVRQPVSAAVVQVRVGS